jgi:hypothetical protein
MKRQRKILHFVIMALISLLERRNEHQMIIGAVSNDSMIEIGKIKSKYIAKICPANWGSILKSLCMRSRAGFNRHHSKIIISSFTILH